MPNAATPFRSPALESPDAQLRASICGSNRVLLLLKFYELAASLVLLELALTT